MSIGEAEYGVNVICSKCVISCDGIEPAKKCMDFYSAAGNAYTLHT